MLKGELSLRLRVPSVAPRGSGGRTGRTTRARGASPKDAPAGLDGAGQARFDALKSWRTEVAREHGLPPYIVFSNATLAEMARAAPDSLAALGEVSGVGAKKLEAYGREILRVLEGV